MKQFEKISDYPPELKGRFNSFIVTQFDDSMTVEMQLRVLRKWILKNIDLTNDMIEYLNKFIEEFDAKLYTTVKKVLEKWLEDGLLAEIANEIIGYIGDMDSWREWDKTLIEKTHNEFKERSYNAKWYGVKCDGVTDDSKALSDLINLLSKINATDDCEIDCGTNYEKTINIIIPDDIVLLNQISIPSNIKLHFKGGLLIPNCRFNQLYEHVFHFEKNTYNNGIYGLTFDGLQFGALAAEVPKLIYIDKDCSSEIKNCRFTNFNLNLAIRNYIFIEVQSGFTGHIADIYSNNIKARGNGVITDENGSIRVIVMSKDREGINNPSVCLVENIFTKEFYSIDSSGLPVEEDSDVIHVYSDGVGNDIKLKNFSGINCGKRVIKVQLTNGVHVDGVYILNNDNRIDVSYGISFLSSERCSLKNAHGYGVIQRFIECNNVKSMTISDVITNITDVKRTDFIMTGVYFSTLWINDCEDLSVSNVTGTGLGLLRFYGSNKRVLFSSINYKGLAYLINMFTNTGDHMEDITFMDSNIQRVSSNIVLPNNVPVKFNKTASDSSVKKLKIINTNFYVTSEYIYAGVLFTGVEDLFLSNIFVTPNDPNFSRTIAFWNCKGLVNNLICNDTYNSQIFSQISQGSKIEFVNSKTGVLNVDGESTMLTITRCDITVWFSGGAWAGNEERSGNIIPYISKWTEHKE